MVDTRLIELRSRRDGLLLKSRTEKNTERWKRAYRTVTAELNALANHLREERNRTKE